VHELSITRNVVAICAERAGGAQVLRVTVEVGKLSAVMPEAMRFCFDLCARDTPLEGAALDIIETEGRARCRECGAELAIERLTGRCRCGSSALQVIAGEELKIREMEIG
jgi:hydrogenase nickel incorporation protein HypA/HybF